MIERVLVIDPGERVGWVRAEIKDGEIQEESLVQGVHTIRDFAEALYHGCVVEQRYDTVVFETWRLRADVAKQMIGNEFLPSQLIGMIRLCCWLGKTRIKSLGPETKKTGRKVMPEFMLKRLKRSSEEHDKDALDLLSTYWWKTYMKEGANG